MLDDADRSLALPDEHADLRVTETTEEPEDDHVALLARELAQGHPDRVEVGRTLDEVPGLDGSDGPPVIVTKVFEVASSPAEVDHGVPCDAEDPRPEREASLFVARQRLDHLQEDLLEEVLGVGWLSDADEDELETRSA